MSWLLKIIQGPNAGAEIALPDSGRVKLGAGDGCDLVVADSTLPAEAVELDCSATGVSATILAEGCAIGPNPVAKGDTKPLAPFDIVALGSTRFAIGPDGQPWPAIDIPVIAAPSVATPAPPASDAPESSAPAPEDSAPDKPVKADKPGSHRAGSAIACFARWLFRTICWTIFWLAFAALAFLAFTFVRNRVAAALATASKHEAVVREEIRQVSGPTTLEALAEAVPALTLTNVNGRPKLVGSFTNRADRVAVVRAARRIHPDVDFDVCDDESMSASVEELLLAVSDGQTKLEIATNRVIRLTGRAASREALARTVAAICADVPHVALVDDSAVETPDGLGSANGPTAFKPLDDSAVIPAATPMGPKSLVSALPENQVAGIIVSPFPCLVLRNGSRAAKGAVVNGWTVDTISEEKVILKKGEDELIWQP